MLGYILERRYVGFANEKFMVCELRDDGLYLYLYSNIHRGCSTFRWSHYSYIVDFPDFLMS